MRRVLKGIAGGVLVLVAATACSDDPLSENRDDAEYFYLNPTVGTVDVGGKIPVTAVAMNRHGAPVGAAVTGTPCDGRITARRDSTRTAFEEPERFIVTGVTAGASCLVVRGGGLQDTISIVVRQ